jgi:hypothetical protein
MELVPLLVLFRWWEIFSSEYGKRIPGTHICTFRLEEYLSIRGAEYLASIGYPVDSASPGHDLGVTQDPSVRSEYKPGAGLAPGEVIMPHEARKQNVTGRGWFNLGGNKGQQQTGTQVPVAAQGGVPRYGATSSAAERAL